MMRVVGRGKDTRRATGVHVVEHMAGARTPPHSPTSLVMWASDATTTWTGTPTVALLRTMKHLLMAAAACLMMLLGSVSMI